MEKINPKKYIVMLALISFLISCGHNQKINPNQYHYQISIPNGIGIEEDETINIFSKFLKQSPRSRYAVEIVIYSYSSGKETFFYSKNTNGNIRKDTQEGSIGALMKIKEKNNLLHTHFLKAAGNSKDELIKKIAVEAREILH